MQLSCCSVSSCSSLYNIQSQARGECQHVKLSHSPTILPSGNLELTDLWSVCMSQRCCKHTKQDVMMSVSLSLHEAVPHHVYHLLSLHERIEFNDSLPFCAPPPHSFSSAAREAEDVPPNLTEEGEKKKHKKPKKISNIHNAITGFEKAFEQFATAGAKNSKSTAATHSEVGNPLTPEQSDITPDSKLDASSTQVRLVHLGDFSSDM